MHTAGIRCQTFEFQRQKRYSGPCGEPCHSSISSTCHSSPDAATPQRHQLLHLEYYEPHNRPRPTFFILLLKIEDDGKASCTIPPRNLLRTPATYKGNGTTHESTLFASPHKQRRRCFDTCSIFHHAPLWIFASMLVRPGSALDLTWPHFVRVTVGVGA